MNISIKLPTIKALFGASDTGGGLQKNRVLLPRAAIEETHSSYGFFRGVTSGHTNDLKSIFAAIAITVFLILGAQLYWDGLLVFHGVIPILEFEKIGESKYLPLFIPAAVSIVVGAILTLFQIGKKRFAAVDLFSMEMLSIVRLIAISDIINMSKKYIRVSKLEKPDDQAQMLRELSAGLSLFGEDNFAEVFVQNTGELGWLDAEIVDYTTGFYTFVRSLHNVANSFKTYVDKNGDDVNDPVILKYIEDMTYIIDTAMDNAYRAFGGLVQNKAHRESAQHSALFVGTRANNLLLFDLLSERHGKFTTSRRRYDAYKNAIMKLR